MTLSRRDFLKASSVFALQTTAGAQTGVVVNDIHSQLNPTRVREVVRAGTATDIGRAIWEAESAGLSICIAGGRHAMGAQQFARE